MKSRSETIKTIVGSSFDVCVIGAGATGAGCALDAQLRKLKTVLVDAGDFASAASSASTKLFLIPMASLTIRDTISHWSKALSRRAGKL